MGTRKASKAVCCVLFILLCCHYILYRMSRSQSRLTSRGTPRTQPFCRPSTVVNTSGRENVALNITMDRPEEGTEAIIMFYALPKCGSRTLLSLAYMSREYTNSSLSIDSNLTTFPNDMFHDEDFARDYLLRYLEHLSKPLFMYTHARFVDLRKDGTKPKYVSVIRDPLDRLVSSYYYKRNRDRTILTEKEKLWRSQLTKLRNETFDECVRNQRRECMGAFNAISTIAHFCGSSNKCNSNGKRALEMAKRNVVNHFAVVGIMEDYVSFVQVIEAYLPATFSGATYHYFLLQNETNALSNTKTLRKVPPSKETNKIMTERLKYDYEFYNFIKDRFKKQKADLGLGL